MPRHAWPALPCLCSASHTQRRHACRGNPGQCPPRLTLPAPSSVAMPSPTFQDGPAMPFRAETRHAGPRPDTPAQPGHSRHAEPRQTEPAKPCHAKLCPAQTGHACRASPRLVLACHALPDLACHAWTRRDAPERAAPRPSTPSMPDPLTAERWSREPKEHAPWASARAASWDPWPHLWLPAERHPKRGQVR